MIEFWLNARSGVPPYLQIVQQVKQAILLGRLKSGDQLPTVRDVVSRVAINPNTVFKAYRDLERDGVVQLRPGQGTFVRLAPRAIAPAEFAALRRRLVRWMESAREVGLEPDAILALLTTTFQEVQQMKEDTA